jgi:hypothetical protein
MILKVRYNSSQDELTIMIDSVKDPYTDGLYGLNPYINIVKH